MSIGALDAASAYGRAIGTAGIAGGVGIRPSTGASEADGPDFGNMVQGLIGDAAQSLRAAESASAMQVAGQGDLIDVVTAIGAAETALDTVVAVRDRVVNAYSEIMRMQI